MFSPTFTIASLHII